MREGIHESLLTKGLSRDLEALGHLRQVVEAVDEADQPHVLARHIRDIVLRSLESTKDQTQRLELVNDLLTILDNSDEAVEGKPDQLLSLTQQPGPGVSAQAITRPRTPLSDAALLTNAHGEPSLGAELRAELDSADQVDLLAHS